MTCQKDLDNFFFFKWCKSHIVMKWLMPFNMTTCTLIKVGQTERFYYDYYLLQVKYYGSLWGDFKVDKVPSIPPEHYIKSIVVGVKYLLADIKIAYKYMDKKIFRKYLQHRPKLQYKSQVWLPHMKKHVDIIEKVQWRATKFTSEIKELSYKDRLAVIILAILEERQKRGNMVTTFKFQNQSENVDSSSSSILAKRVQWNRWMEEAMWSNCGGKQLQKLHNSIKSLREGAPQVQNSLPILHY